MLTGTRKSTCAKGSATHDVHRDNVSLDVDYVTSAESVYRFVETNASAQFGIGVGQKVSMSFGMSREQFFSAKSTVLAIAEKSRRHPPLSRGRTLYTILVNRVLIEAMLL